MSIDGGPFKAVTCNKVGAEPKPFASILLPNGSRGYLQCENSLKKTPPLKDDPFSDYYEFEKSTDASSEFSGSIEKETNISIFTTGTDGRVDEAVLSDTFEYKDGEFVQLIDTRAWLTRAKDPSVDGSVDPSLFLVVVRAMSMPDNSENETGAEDGCNIKNNYCHICMYDFTEYTWDAKTQTWDIFQPPPKPGVKPEEIVETAFRANTYMSRFTKPLNILPACLDKNGKWREEPRHPKNHGSKKSLKKIK